MKSFKVSISNFRSIKNASLEIAPLTFIYGNNATGKSSVFYALNIFRNIILEPNQEVDTFFNLGFANLGGFKSVVFKHDESQPISISVNAKINNVIFNYQIKLEAKKGEFSLETGKPYSLKLNLPITFPYPLNKHIEERLILDNTEYIIAWTGLTFQVSTTSSSEENNKKAKELNILLNKIGEIIRSIDVIPLRRGFTKPQYGIVPIEKFAVTENQLVSSLAQNEYLDSRVSTYLEQIMDRQFRVRIIPGTSVVKLTTTEKESKQTVDIVNDGFGVNQLVYLLAKTLDKNSNIICIEEPEINLHPGVVRKLPSVLFDIAKEEKKRMIISTHSEIMLVALLSNIAKGEINSNDVAAYLVTRKNGVSSFEKQVILENGQIVGGLTSFMEGELEDIEGLFKKSKKNTNNNQHDSADRL